MILQTKSHQTRTGADCQMSPTNSAVFEGAFENLTVDLGQSERQNNGFYELVKIPHI